MAKLTGFMDYTRKTSTDVPPLERIENFNEFHIWLSHRYLAVMAGFDADTVFAGGSCAQGAAAYLYGVA